MIKEVKFEFLKLIKKETELKKELNNLNGKTLILHCEVYDESDEIEINIHTEDFDYDKTLIIMKSVVSILEDNIDSIIEELNILKDYLELNYNCEIEVIDELVYLPE